MMSNDSLIKSFVRGDTSGKSNRMAIEETDNWTLLWGYGWALYAARRKDDETLFVYDGWNGYSSTTSTHMNNLARKVKSNYPMRDHAKESLRAKVSVGPEETETEIETSEAEGRVGVICPEADPRHKWGQMKTQDRDEISDLSGVTAPEGGGGSSRY